LQTYKSEKRWRNSDVTASGCISCADTEMSPSKASAKIEQAFPSADMALLMEVLSEVTAQEG